MSTSQAILPPQVLVEKIKKLQEKYPSLDLREILRVVFLKQDFALVSLGNVLDLEEVAYIPSAFQLGKQTRLEKLRATLQQYTQAKATPIGQAIGAEAFKVGAPENITVPFSVINTESGAVVEGEVVEGLLDQTIQMTPVSSSTVMASGMFHNELLVQFLPSGNTPTRTYRYKFEAPEQAKEAHESLINSGSPGRWIWQNVRGHTAGEPVDASKLAPSLSPPGKGLPTIGGTTASLVPYTIGNRTPVGRVKGFEKMVPQLQRATSNPALIPQETRVEAQLQARGALRSLGLKGFRTGSGVLGLPKLDFNVKYIGNVLDLAEDYPVKEHTRESGKVSVKAHTRGEGLDKKFEIARKNKEKETGRIILSKNEYYISQLGNNRFSSWENYLKDFGIDIDRIRIEAMKVRITPKELRRLKDQLIELYQGLNPSGDIGGIDKEILRKETIERLGLTSEEFDDLILSMKQIQEAVEQYGRDKHYIHLRSVPSKLQSKDFAKDSDALSECTSRGYTEEECFKFFNAAKTKATEKAKEPYRPIVTSPSGRVKFYDISTLKRQLTETERERLKYVDQAVENFPKKLFDQVHPDIVIVDKIPDHPRWSQYKGKVPVYYQQVGINRTYEEVGGAYDIYRNECIISLKNTGYHVWGTVYHEIAHAIWNWGNIPLHLKERLAQDLEIAKTHKIDKYYESLSELHSLLWELHRSKHIFNEKYVMEEFMEKSGTTESDAKTILRTFDLIREWAEQ